MELQKLIPVESSTSLENSSQSALNDPQDKRRIFRNKKHDVKTKWSEKINIFRQKFKENHKKILIGSLIILIMLIFIFSGPIGYVAFFCGGILIIIGFFGLFFNAKKGIKLIKFGIVFLLLGIFLIFFSIYINYLRVRFVLILGEI